MIVAGGGLIFVVGFMLVMLMLSLALTAFWIWMLVDCVRNRNIGSDEKVVWVVVIALLHFLGALIYFFAARHRRPPAQPQPVPQPA